MEIGKVEEGVTLEVLIAKSSLNGIMGTQLKNLLDLLISRRYIKEEQGLYTLISDIF